MIQLSRNTALEHDVHRLRINLSPSLHQALVVEIVPPDRVNTVLHAQPVEAGRVVEQVLHLVGASLWHQALDRLGQLLNVLSA